MNIQTRAAFEKWAKGRDKVLTRSRNSVERQDEWAEYLRAEALERFEKHGRPGQVLKETAVQEMWITMDEANAEESVARFGGKIIARKAAR